MKFFTPDLLERFGSEDDRVALAAQEELEQRSEQYARHLHDIEPKLPARFREMQQRFYLHDARVVGPWFPDLPDALSWLHLVMPGLPIGWRPPAADAGRWPSFWLAVQLDTPPREFLVLHYRSVLIEETRRRRPLRDEGCPYLEWQYDEVELVPTQEGSEFCHAILFTNGFELRLRFNDFDFATLKPMGVPSEHEDSGRRALT
jgi:hypothetical protein